MMRMTTGSLLDTDDRFEDYCNAKGIADPFRESARRCTAEERNGHKITIIRGETEEEKAWTQEWKKRRDEYLRLRHTFRLWDAHFWMDWETFAKFCEYAKFYTDVDIYMPCDCAERQCNMACTYFGGKCPRTEEELKTPEILGFEGRWKYHDGY